MLVASLALFGRGSFGGRFRSLKSLSAYATALFYSLNPKPKIDDLRSMLATLQSLAPLLAMSESANEPALVATPPLP